MTEVWTQLSVTSSPLADESELHMPTPVSDLLKSPDAYLPDEGLVTAANVALLLGQPLLITGEPGCGKTAFAWWLSTRLGLGQPLVDVVKSTSTGRDLLYDFDSLARFRDSQPGAVTSPRDSESYVRFHALGAAIACSTDSTVLGLPLFQRVMEVVQAPERGGINVASGQRRHVVLIDELDKAPRDTPNDLLHEIEKMDFSIPEIGRNIPGNADYRPIVVITSNTEKSLPDPFLRRCVYYNIPELDPETGPKRLLEILNSRANHIAKSDKEEDKMLAEAFRRHGAEKVHAFFGLRQEFRRSPGVAEYLALSLALARQEIAARQREKRVDPKALWEGAMTSIAKIKEDREKALRAIAAPS